MKNVERVIKEVLGLLVGDSSTLYVNWGETSTDTTTAVKRINNDNKPHTTGCKVDGRIVCRMSKVVGTCHVEAARASSISEKIYSGKFKPAAESTIGSTTSARYYRIPYIIPVFGSTTVSYHR
ncbi:unnamed protein product [Mucor fragilis]